MDVDEVVRLAAAFDDPSDGLAWKSREITLAMLRHTGEPFSRTQFTPGHVTCTGLVVAPSGDRVLFVHHGSLDRWLLPGGHIEPQDRGPADTARREVIEETSVVLDSRTAPVLVGIDVHGIPPKRGEPFHLHHDLIFAFRAASEHIVHSPESRAVQWLEPGDFNVYDVPANIVRAFERALRVVC